MKKQLALVAGMALLATSAYASKARLNALGQSNDGSAYINDNRSVFLNPAQLANNSKYLTMEWGTSQGGVGNSNSDDPYTPTAEGGYFGTFPMGHGHYAYGVYLNNQDNEANGECRNDYLTPKVLFAPVVDCVGRSTTTAAAGDAATNFDFLPQENNVDLFFAGAHHSGLKWGASFWWADGEEDGVWDRLNQVHGAATAGLAVERKSWSMGYTLGVEWNNIEAWWHHSLEDKAEGAKSTAAITHIGGVVAHYDQKSNWEFGASYDWKKYTFFAGIERREAELMTPNNLLATAVLVKNDLDRDSWHVGVGYTKKLNAKTTLYANLKYLTRDAGFKITPTGATPLLRAGATTQVAKDAWYVPLTLAFETHVTSWLEARGSVTQNLAAQEAYSITMNQSAKTNDNKVIPLGSTDVAVGATLHFGNLKVDGLIGTSATGAGPAKGIENGVLRLDALMSRVGMHYHF